MLDNIASRQTIGRHLLLLESALDKFVASQIAARRDGGGFSFCFASDESPPAENRYTGIRFQITYIFFNIYEYETSWSCEWVAPEWN